MYGALIEAFRFLVLSAKSCVAGGQSKTGNFKVDTEKAAKADAAANALLEELEREENALEEAKKKIYETIKFDSLVYAMSGKSIDTINDVPWNIEEIFKWGGFIPQDESVVDGVKAEDDIIQ